MKELQESYFDGLWWVVSQLKPIFSISIMDNLFKVIMSLTGSMDSLDSATTQSNGVTAVCLYYVPEEGCLMSNDRVTSWCGNSSRLPCHAEHSTVMTRERVMTCTMS
jgi:transketolase N-terminal domain/subunit